MEQIKIDKKLKLSLPLFMVIFLVGCNYKDPNVVDSQLTQEQLLHKYSVTRGQILKIKGTIDEYIVITDKEYPASNRRDHIKEMEICKKEADEIKTIGVACFGDSTLHIDNFKGFFPR
jgi:hypothetical protein